MPAIRNWLLLVSLVLLAGFSVQVSASPTMSNGKFSFIAIIFGLIFITTALVSLSFRFTSGVRTVKELEEIHVPSNLIPSYPQNDMVVLNLVAPSIPSMPAPMPSGRGRGRGRSNAPQSSSRRSTASATARTKLLTDFEAEKEVIKAQVTQLRTDMNRVSAQYLTQIGQRIFHLEKQRLNLEHRKVKGAPSETAIAKELGFKLKEYRSIQRWVTHERTMRRELGLADTDTEFNFKEIVASFDRLSAETWRHVAAFENASQQVQEDERARVEEGYKRLNERAAETAELNTTKWLKYLSQSQIDEVLDRVPGKGNQRFILDMMVSNMKKVARKKLNRSIMASLAREDSVESIGTPDQKEQAENDDGNAEESVENDDGNAAAPQVDPNAAPSGRDAPRVSPRTLKIKYPDLEPLIDLMLPIATTQSVGQACREIERLMANPNNRNVAEQFDIQERNLVDYPFLRLENQILWGNTLSLCCDGYEEMVMDSALTELDLVQDAPEQPNR